MTVDSVELKHYEALAHAIIVQAVIDYKAARRILLKHPEDLLAQAEIKKIKRFFHSRYYRTLTNVDGDYLIKKIEADIEAETDTEKIRAYRSKGRVFGYGNK